MQWFKKTRLGLWLYRLSRRPGLEGQTARLKEGARRAQEWRGRASPAARAHNARQEATLAAFEEKHRPAGSAQP